MGAGSSLALRPPSPLHLQLALPSWLFETIPLYFNDPPLRSASSSHHNALYQEAPPSLQSCLWAGSCTALFFALGPPLRPALSLRKTMS